jgi:nuclear transport factor 2 (NTF2) superfamily protein
MAEDAWNSRDPSNRVVQVYTEDTQWRNRAEFPVGLHRDRAGPRRCAAFSSASGHASWTTGSSRSCGPSPENRIAVRFAYEWRDDSGHWFRSYGNENWGRA